ncbi:hypothetical protein [Chryseobacterium gossypii]|uniref:hypothetical protein n=1 Tax=Chryseobacterium gossypii TaxID=3231602 RepID=UPI0035264CCB
MNHFKLIGFFLFLFLFTQSCRNESLVLEQEDQPKYNYNIAVLNKEQFENKVPLFQEVDKLKTNFFRQTTGKTINPQDPILEGAIIETNRVLEITDGTNNKTYTFPVSRIFPNNVVENLVLRENADHTYSGILIQYSLSKQEKDQYLNGATIDLNGKIKTYIINNISQLGKGSTYSYYEGCWEYVYETNPCTAGGNHSYGDGSCEALGTGQAAQPSQIIAAYNHCDDGGSGSTGGGSGSDSGGGWGGTGTGSSGTGGGSGGGGGTYNPNTNPYNTFLFASFDDMFDMCPTDDMQCQADMLLSKQVQQYLLGLNMNASQLASYSPIWFAIRDYFKVNGGDEFLTQRLNLIGNWFKTQDNTNPDVKLSNFKFAKWVLDLSFESDTQDFQNFFNRLNALNDAVIQNPNLLLDMPCGELPKWQDVATHQVPQSVKTKLQNIKNQTSWWSNWQITDLDDGASARINMDVFPIHINSLPNKPNSTQKYTPEEFFNFFRLNLNLFAEKFTPIADSYYGINDTALWNSSDPLGALIHIEIPIDNGTVICSGFGPKAWVFSTIKAPMSMGYDGIHPVAGNRLFGYYIDSSDNTMYIYTRGVDRVSQVATNSPNLANYLIEVSAFYGADQLWRGMQDKLAKYINDRGGNANKIPETTYRPNYNKVRSYLKGNALLSSLGCN